MRELLEKEQSIYEELLKQINFSVFGNRACREIISLVDDLIDEIYKNENKEDNMEAELKLKQYLVEHGIKQKFICDKTGIDKATISNILNGRRKLTANELLVISRAIDLPLDFFNQEVNN